MPVSAADRARLAGLAAAAILVGLTAMPPAPVAAAPLPLEVPLPPPRPDAKSVAPTPSSEPVDATAEPPVPPPRPADLGASAAVAATPEMAAEESACRERLLSLGVRFEPLPEIVEGACGAPYPLRIKSLPDGLDISAPATLVCAAAEALARWTREVVMTEARRHLEAQPTRIAIGTSYECRNQNRQITGKLSEHAFANGVDISGFDFKGRKAVAIGEHAPETPEALFQQAIRSQACTYFTTVLGPGSDEAHATHLHLDLRGRGRGFRLCQ